VDEIASFAIHAAVVLLEVLALFGLVFVVKLVIFQQLVGSVSEFASCLIGTNSKIHETAT